MYWVTGILGLVSGVAPYVLGYSSNQSALWTSLIVGATLILVSAMEWMAEGKQAWEYWVAAIVGVGAIAAPFVLGFSGLAVAVWTMVIIGAGVIVAAGTKLFFGVKEGYGY